MTQSEFISFNYKTKTDNNQPIFRINKVQFATIVNKFNQIQSNFAKELAINSDLKGHKRLQLNSKQFGIQHNFEPKLIKKSDTCTKPITHELTGT